MFDFLDTQPDTVWGYANIGAGAHTMRKLYRTLHEPQSPYLAPAKTQKLLNSLHRQLNIDASYGGWLEDRFWLWQGNYLDTAKKYTHLGYDFNVSAGTEVRVTRECKVVHIDDDNPLKGGWGPRVIVKLESGDGYLIYAHLMQGDIRCIEDERLDSGSVIGSIGEPKHNGKWFAHLHTQLITNEGWDYYSDSKHFEKMDGYCSEKELPRMLRYFGDPLPYVV